MENSIEEGYYNIRHEHVSGVAKYFKEGNYWQIHNTRIVLYTEEIEIFDKIDKPTWGTEYK